MIIVKRVFILLIIFLSVANLSVAQDIWKGNDLSKVRIDQLPDAEILKFQQQYKAAGISQAQAEQAAVSKGLPQSELSKLRDRLSRLQMGSNSNDNKKNQNDKSGENSDYQSFSKDYISEKQSRVFGSMLFNTPSLSFEPNLRIATPVNYILGPDDELSLTIYGLQEANSRLLVEPDGTINVPQAGVIAVAGLTIEDASKRIKEKLIQHGYNNITTGLTKFNLSLSKIKSIRVTIIGATKPGNYTVSSMSTVFNALYLCGGPDSISSYREIELLRNNKPLQKIDLYDFLIKGEQKGNVVLKEGDVINIPVYKGRVSIDGEVKRPGIYELKTGESLSALIKFAGEFTEKAYTASVRIKQMTDRERRVKDVLKNEYDNYLPQKGDAVMVDSVLNRYENRVVISGAVYRPGEYELTPGLTLKGLILKSDGVKEDVFLQRGLLVRRKEDLSRQAISFQVNEVLKGGAADILLKKEDSVLVGSIFSFRDTLKVNIEGEVHKPGTYDYHENISLKDLLFEAGGFKDAGSNYRIEVSRRINQEQYDAQSDIVAEVFDLNTEKDLDVKGEHFILKPFDLVTIRKKPGYIEQKRVVVNGEVQYPGYYTIKSKKERISDLISRSGGLTKNAYPEGVSLYKKNRISESEKQDKLEKLQTLQFQVTNKDSSKTAEKEINKEYTQIGIDVNQIIKSPGGPEDVLLEEGDSLVVPKLDLLIKVSGEVWSPTKVNYVPGRSAKYYIDEAGGMTGTAFRSHVYVLHANGRAATTHRYVFGLIKSYPKLLPGSEIIVPKITKSTRVSSTEIIGLASALASMAGVVIAIIKL